MRTLVPLLLATALAPTACVITPEKYPRPIDLAQSWEVDRLRILGISAEPPEVVPGQTSIFDALVADPNGELGFLTWLACPPEEPGGIGFGCELDPELIEEDASLDDLVAAGVLLFPEYTPEDDVLVDLTDEERAEGLYVTIQVTALPEGLDENLEEIDFNNVEAAYKRLVVSEASTPNHNPTVHQFTVDGVEIPADSVVIVEAGQEYDLGVPIPDESIETYEFVNEGTVEERVEEPYISWYTTDRTMYEP